jgi:hypothetical protein
MTSSNMATWSSEEPAPFKMNKSVTRRMTAARWRGFFLVIASSSSSIRDCGAAAWPLSRLGAEFCAWAALGDVVPLCGIFCDS